MVDQTSRLESGGMEYAEPGADGRSRPRSKKRLIFLAAAVIAVLCIGLIAFLMSRSSSPSSELEDLEAIANFSYVSIIDAGSSGSRIHCFKFFKKCGECPVLVSREELVKKVEPGLSSFAEDPEKAGESIKSLLQVLENFVPPEKRPTTPVTLQATAGLRLLPEPQRDAILEEIRKVISNSPFKPLPDGVGIMSGTDEGVNGWVGINYLLDKLYKKPSEMAAALDLGGASTQVTFPLLSGKERFPKEDVVSFRVANNDIELYSHSYLGLGMNAARLAILGSGSPAGVTTYASPCVSPKHNGSTITYNAKLYTVNGIGSKSGPLVDMAGCSIIVNNYLLRYNITEPTGIQQFDLVAFSGFFYTAQSAGLVDSKNNEATLDQMSKRAIEVCWGIYKVEKQPFLCSDLTYATNLLFLYGLQRTTTLHFVRELNKHDVSWAIGLAFKVAQEAMSKAS